MVLSRCYAGICKLGVDLLPLLMICSIGFPVQWLVAKKVDIAPGIESKCGLW